MPLIKDQYLLDLYTELDQLKSDKENLRTGFIDLRVKTKKIEKDFNTTKIFFILMLLLLVLSWVFMSFKTIEYKDFLRGSNKNRTALIDSIQKLNPLISVKKKPVVSYAVQLGVYKTLDINYNNTEGSNFQKRNTTQGSAYQIGNFTKYRAATIFKNKIKELGLKDAFLVAFNKDFEIIDIKDALVLSNEKELLKD